MRRQIGEELNRDFVGVAVKNLEPGTHVARIEGRMFTEATGAPMGPDTPSIWLCFITILPGFGLALFGFGFILLGFGVGFGLALVGFQLPLGF